MKIALKKILAAIAAIIVFALIATLARGLVAIYQDVFFDLSDPALAIIEDTSSILGVVFAVILSIKTYKRFARTPISARKIRAAYE